MVRQSELDLCTFTEADVTNAKEVIAALKPMKDATSVTSEESSPTVSVIAPFQAQLLDETKDSPGPSRVSTLVKEIKQAIHKDLSKRYSSDQGKQFLHTAAALDPLFKGAALPVLGGGQRGKGCYQARNNFAILFSVKCCAVLVMFNLFSTVCTI